jgi:acyl-coenzyme A synthetase/AMP-(fatty) acid ligase
MRENLEAKVLRFMAAPDEAGFESLAFEIYAFQRDHNLVYARYCERLGAGIALETWKQIPALPQQAFKQQRILAFPETGIRFEFRTSGTTGEGYGRHFLPSLELYQHAVLAGWRHFGLPEQEIRLLLMQPPEYAPYSSLARMGAILAGNRAEAFLIDARGRIESDRMEKAVAERQQPAMLFGTALALVNLLEQSSPMPLPAGSLLMETGGFKGSNRVIDKPELYDRLANHFQVRSENIWNEYGMTELTSQFYSRGARGSHFGPPWLRFLVIDPETNRPAAVGQTGVLRIFDLANLWSVLGIQTQDLAVARPDGGFQLLGRDPAALPRGCSRTMDELLQMART